MEVPNAAERNGATTSSFSQQLLIVSGFFKLRDAATSLARGFRGAAFRNIQEKEEVDLEVGPPEAAEETNVQTIIRTTSIEHIVEKLKPTFPATFIYFTLPALLCLAQIKWQLSPLGFPSSALHNWYIVCVTSLLMEFVASIAQSIIPASGDGTANADDLILDAVNFLDMGDADGWSYWRSSGGSYEAEEHDSGSGRKKKQKPLKYMWHNITHKSQVTTKHTFATM